MNLITQIKNLKNKRVLVRVDFNEPVARGKLIDDSRIRAALPTIRLLIKNGAKVILMTHMGRPATKRELRIRNYELGAVVERLGELLKRKVAVVEKWDFGGINKTVKKLKAGQVLMLPNLRLHAGEEKNDEEFAKDLAAIGQIYVNEAFSVDHRAHASLVGVPKFLPAYAGLRLEKEIGTLQSLISHHKYPLIVLMGGGKITDKIAMLQNMTHKATAILVGGALATHFFKAMGYGVGASAIDSKGVKMAKRLLRNKKIILPLDVVVGKKDGGEARVVGYTEIGSPSRRRSNLLFPKVICKKPYAILDIGPKTILQFSRFIKTAQTLVWNGPMGLYEIKSYSHGTLALGRLFAARSRGFAFGVIGGGETIDAMNKTGMSQYVDFISTGGGAMLAYLGGEQLPGLEALIDNK